jgi:hypothetical protein
MGRKVQTAESKVLQPFSLAKTEVFKTMFCCCTVCLSNRCIANALSKHRTLPMCQDRVFNLGAEPSRNTENDSILTERRLRP